MGGGGGGGRQEGGGGRGAGGGRSSRSSLHNCYGRFSMCDFYSVHRCSLHK